MEKLEMVEQVREASGVSYEEARAALEACDYDVLDAIVALERSGKQEEPSARYELPQDGETAHAEQAQAEAKASKGEKAKRAWSRFCTRAKALLRSGLDTAFVIERNGADVTTLPVLFVVIGLIAWGAALWLMIIGLFFGFRYRIEGTGAITSGVNDAMAKAADAAGDIKGSLS